MNPGSRKASRHVSRPSALPLDAHRTLLPAPGACAILAPLLLAVPHVLTAEQVAGVRARLDVATWGSGTVSFFWLQSMVRDNERRALLFAVKLPGVFSQPAAPAGGDVGVGKSDGAGSRFRTGDLPLTRRVLYQLS